MIEGTITCRRVGNDSPSPSYGRDANVQSERVNEREVTDARARQEPRTGKRSTSPLPSANSTASPSYGRKRRATPDDRQNSSSRSARRRDRQTTGVCENLIASFSFCVRSLGSPCVTPLFNRPLAHRPTAVDVEVC